MRFVSLESPGYGRFSNLSLDGFAPFTIVHGPNEAGKSTLRRLLRDILFGFPLSATRNHPYAFARTMEARAAIALQDGRNLTIHRKRSTQEFLRIEPADATNDAWKALLGGLDDALYGRILCCSAQEMEGTSRALREGSFLETVRTDISGGLRGMKELLAESDAALARFRSGQGHPRLRRELDQIQKQLGAENLSWKDLGYKTDSVKDLERRIEALRIAIAEQDDRIRGDERRLEIAQAREEADILAESLRLQGAPLEFPHRARERAADLGRERDRLRADVQALEAARRVERDALALLPPPDRILDADESIFDTLLGRRHGVESLLRELPGRQERILSERIRLGENVAAIIPGWSVERFLEEAPAETAYRNLSNVWKSLVEARANAAQTDRDLRQVRETLEGMEPPGDLSERQRALADLWIGESAAIEAARRSAEREEPRLENARRAFRRFEPRLVLAGLPPVEELMRRPLPPQADVERIAAAWNRASERLAASTRRRDEADAALADLSNGVPPDAATRERRDARRERRDALWQCVKARLEGSPLLDREATLLDDEADLAAAFEAATRDADHDADALLAQGDRARRIERLKAEKISLKADIPAAKVDLAALRAEWDSLWNAAGIAPGSDPDAGRAWLATRLEAQDPWLEIEESKRNLSNARAILSAFAERAREALGLPSLSPEDAYQHTVASSEKAQRQKSGRAAFERENVRLRDDIARSEESLLEMRRVVDEREAAWRKACETTFPGMPKPEAPSSFLESLERALAARVALRDSARANAADEAELDAISRALQPVLDSLSLSGKGAALLGTLLDRWSDARKVRSEREQGTIRFQGVEAHLAQRKNDLALLESPFLSLWRESNVLDEVGFESALASFEKAAPSRTRLDAIHRRLETASPADLEGAAERSAGHWREVLETSRREQAERSAERDRLQHEKGGLERELSDLARQNDDPLRLRQGLRQRADALNAEARCHLRNRMVRLVLQRAGDSFASRHTPPLQAWSGRYLSTITDGRWDSIDLSGDEHIQIASAARNETLGEQTLSTGTADQVRLALRMAAARQWAAAHEPLPFLLDDVLATTDAERMERALSALRELSRDVQVIYFTCHRSVAERGAAAGASIVEI